MGECGIAQTVTTVQITMDMSMSTLNQNMLSIQAMLASSVKKCWRQRQLLEGISRTVALKRWFLNNAFLDVENAVNNKMYKDGVMWICTECNYESQKKVHVFEHIEGKHQVHDGYFCQSCQQVFKTKGKFQRHYKNCQSQV